MYKFYFNGKIYKYYPIVALSILKLKQKQITYKFNIFKLL